jgi:ADP-ribose pyrophosphatase YjhB (NUDIX family)
MDREIVAVENLTETNKILKTLMHFPGSNYSDLWDKEIPSNKFNYYLKKLENDNIIEKNEGKYYLTLKGKEFVTTICGETGKKEERPIVALLLVLRKKVNRKSKYILYKRMKEPYYEYNGFPGAKVKKGEEILCSARRELKEETNLECKGKIIGIQNCIVINNKKLFHHYLQFVILFDEPKGKLIEESREGIYLWEDKEKVLSQEKLFPDIPGVIKAVENNNFYFKELKLIQENEEFVGIEEKRII